MPSTGIDNILVNVLAHALVIWLCAQKRQYLHRRSISEPAAVAGEMAAAATDFGQAAVFVRPPVQGAKKSLLRQPPELGKCKLSRTQMLLCWKVCLQQVASTAACG
ncbi:hypothetical protein NPIL_228561 [Nephila pilipes]|uniref:Uncharacterized protein n=1 Tax=Nephila pilipes TaxID=299642 RepID=A0A8X6PIZ6_NEPPI|nr:hypothetical protein NPIL_228561 [Nephila pilipes]